VEEGQEPQGTGEPVTERARIAGVEAGIAAGLVPSDRSSGAPSLRTGRERFGVGELRRSSTSLRLTIGGGSACFLRAS